MKLIVSWANPRQPVHLNTSSTWLHPVGLRPSIRSIYRPCIRPSIRRCLTPKACFTDLPCKVVGMLQNRAMHKGTAKHSVVCFFLKWLSSFVFCRTYWPDLDGKIREALVLRSVKVRLLISFWKETDPLTFNFISSLKAICTEIANCSLKVVSVLLTMLLNKKDLFPLHAYESCQHTPYTHRGGGGGCHVEARGQHQMFSSVALHLTFFKKPEAHWIG